MSAQQRTELLNLEEVSRFENLLIFAKTLVEGYYSGKHKSPDFGSSAEFAEYRDYFPGDEINKVDWRIYGRSRKLYTRLYEEETDMITYLLLDMSGSMAYKGHKQEEKFLIASRIAAALAYLMIRQGDKVALVLYDEKIRKYIAPGGTQHHLFKIVSELEQAELNRGTEIRMAVSECMQLFRKRGRIVILSDFLGDNEQLFDSVSQFVHRRFDLLLMQILDEDEEQLPYVDNARFIDMESGEEIQVEPGEIRKLYRQLMTEKTDEIAEQSDKRRIQYSYLNARKPYLEAIEAYLGFRGGHK